MSPNKANQPRQSIKVIWLLSVKEPKSKMLQELTRIFAKHQMLFLECNISKWGSPGFTILVLVKEVKFLWLVEKFWILSRCLANTYWNLSNSNFAVCPDFLFFFSDFFQLVSHHAAYETLCSSINIFIGKTIHCQLSQFFG